MAQKSSSNNRIRKSTNPITGIINVVGEPDAGKTWFAMSSGAAPERTAFIDDDVKGTSIKDMVEAEGRHFGFYHNLMLATKGMREVDFHNYCMRMLAEITDMHGEFDALIWDTWTRFENSFHPFVVKNPSKFREFYSQMGQIKGAEQWNAAFEYESATLAALQETFPLIILTSHLKKDASKREIAESKKPLIQKSRMRVWLRHSSDTPVPTGLMLKRLSKVEFSHGMEPVNVTYRKVKNFSWKTLLHYWENPVGNTPPGPDETPNEFELSILDGTLTKDQKDVLHLAVLELEKEKIEEEKQRKRLRQLSHAPVPDEEPDEAFGLMAKAQEKYDMDTDRLLEVLGLNEVEEILEIADIADAWKRVQNYATGKVEVSRKNGKRKK